MNADAACDEEGDIRLRDGPNRSEGRVEVCARTFMNVLRWGTVCSDRWDKNDATVACRQLGLPGLLMIIYSHDIIMPQACK